MLELLSNTSPVDSDLESGQIIASLLANPFENQLIIGDIHAPMNKLSDIYKITDNNKIIGGWTIFRGFDTPIVVFPPGLEKYWDDIKLAVNELNYQEIMVSFPKHSKAKSFPWENWENYIWGHQFTDKAMKFENKELKVMDISNLPKIKPIGVEDADLLNQYFNELKADDSYTGFWHPYQLETELYVAAINDENQIIAVGGTHFETPFSVQLGNIHVKPEYRNQRIGEAITTAIVLGIIRFKRIPSLFVNENNHVAMKLYEKIGFTYYNEYLFYKGIMK